MTEAHKNTILIAFDGSPDAIRAIKYAAKFLGSPQDPPHVILATVWESSMHQAARISAMSGVFAATMAQGENYTHVEDVLRTEALATNNQGVRLAASLGLTAEGHLVELGSTVWQAVVETADKHNVDIIVTGTRGETGLKALIHSSVSEHVLKRSNRPVLVVPAGCADPD